MSKIIGRPKKAEEAKKVKVSFYTDQSILEYLKKDIETGKATNLSNAINLALYSFYRLKTALNS